VGVENHVSALLNWPGDRKAMPRQPHSNALKTTHNTLPLWRGLL